MILVMPPPKRAQLLRSSYGAVNLRPALAGVLLAALLLTAGCAGSLMHSKEGAAKRAARQAQPGTLANIEAAPLSQPAPVSTPRPSSQMSDPSASPLGESAPATVSPPARTVGSALQSQRSKKVVPPPEAPPEPIVVTGSIPRQPKPPVPPISPDTTATIAFTINPTQQCPTCQAVRITVSPTGEVLIERGNWDNVHRDWRYQRTRTKVKRNRANAFAQALNGDRPMGERTLRTAGLACDSHTRDDSLTIQWIEFGRRDRLHVKFDCGMKSDSTLAERLRKVPNVLGIRQITAP